MNEEIHEKIALSIVKKLKEAKNQWEYEAIENKLLHLSDAIKYSTLNSRLEDDLKKFEDNNDDVFKKGSIDKIIQSFLEDVDQKEPIISFRLFICLENRLVKELKVLQDPWETLKIIYALGTLYDNDKKIIFDILQTIEDKMQRRIATICARFCVCHCYDIAYKFFYLSNEI